MTDNTAIKWLFPDEVAQAIGYGTPPRASFPPGSPFIVESVAPKRAAQLISDGYRQIRTHAVYRKGTHVVILAAGPGREISLVPEDNARRLQRDLEGTVAALAEVRAQLAAYEARRELETHRCIACYHTYTPGPEESEDCPVCGCDGTTPKEET